VTWVRGTSGHREDDRAGVAGAGGGRNLWGGITGSVLALALAKRGVSADLVELSPVWRGVGHGITVQGKALAALAKVGVLDEVLSRGVPFNQLRMRQADGTLIAEVPTPRTGGPEPPHPPS
jgi:2-polyprenyl-6-methoxyphenol hydroxylase-like FAD-dependent oxidoreductase